MLDAKQREALERLVELGNEMASGLKPVPYEDRGPLSPSEEEMIEWGQLQDIKTWRQAVASARKVFALPLKRAGDGWHGGLHYSTFRKRGKS